MSARRRICLGLVTGARGLKGEVWIRTFTAEPADIAAYGHLTDEAGARRLRLQVTESRGARVLARIEGVDDRAAAEALRGTRLYVDRSALPVPDADEFYHADLIGCMAVVAGGTAGSSDSIGRISAVHDFGAGAILEIDVVPGDSLMVPFTKACVPEIDLGRGRVRIVPPPDLVADAPERTSEAGEEAGNEQ